MAVRMSYFHNFCIAAIIYRAFHKKLLFCANSTGIKDYSLKILFLAGPSLYSVECGVYEISAVLIFLNQQTYLISLGTCAPKSFHNFYEH